MRNAWLANPEAREDPPRRVLHTRVIDVTVWQYTEEDEAYPEDKRALRTYREHLVPLAALQTRAFEMFNTHATIEDVAKTLSDFLRIACSKKEESRNLNEKSSKNGVPRGLTGEDITPKTYAIG